MISPAEFKAWFEGFSEGLDDTPSDEQWARGIEKVEAIEVEPGQTDVERIRAGMPPLGIPPYVKYVAPS